MMRFSTLVIVLCHYMLAADIFFSIRRQIDAAFDALMPMSRRFRRARQLFYDMPPRFARYVFSPRFSC